MSQTATSSKSANIENHRKRIDRLFLRLAAMYGHVWRSLYKSDEFLAFTKTEWQEGLVAFEDNVMEKALLACRNNREYPPSLPQFIECCKTYRDPGLYRKSNATHKPSSPEVAMAHLKQIKTLLNMN